jgi:hypothetical protein
LEELDWTFGTMETQDKTNHLVASYLEDISGFIEEETNYEIDFSFQRSKGAKVCFFCRFWVVI